MPGLQRCTITSVLAFFFSFFSDYLGLPIMHPNYAHLLILPCLSPHVHPPQKKRRRRKGKKKRKDRASPFCAVRVLREHGHFLVTSNPREGEFSHLNPSQKPSAVDSHAIAGEGRASSPGKGGSALLYPWTSTRLHATAQTTDIAWTSVVTLGTQSWPYQDH